MEVFFNFEGWSDPVQLTLDRVPNQGEMVRLNGEGFQNYSRGGEEFNAEGDYFVQKESTSIHSKYANEIALVVHYVELMRVEMN